MAQSFQIVKRHLIFNGLILLIGLLTLICIPPSHAYDPAQDNPIHVATGAPTKQAQTQHKATQTQKQPQHTASLVNINQADAATLDTQLTGIGPAKAQAIVDYRNAKGPFTAVEQLLEVKGIGPSTLEKNRAKITF